MSVKEYGLSILLKVGELMQETFDIEVLLHIILTCVTKGEGFGFNRAMILLIKNKKIYGKMGVGPFNQEEAQEIWKYMNENHQDLMETLNELASHKKVPTGKFNDYVKTIEFEEEAMKKSILKEALEENKILHIREGINRHLLPSEFMCALGASEFVVVPLISKGKCLGLIVADNIFTRRMIESIHFELIKIFSFQVSKVIEGVTAKKELEKEKSQLEKTIIRLNKIQGSLIQAEKMAIVGKLLIKMAHELRNPLTVIGGYAHVLNKEVTQKSKEKTHIIIKEVERLEELLTEMLEFSKNTKVKYQYENIEKILNRQLFRLTLELQAKEIMIEKHYEKTPKVKLDKEKIAQVFFNIIKNAIAFSEQKGKIKLKIANKEERVHIEIEDEGKGIKNEEKEKVFQAFFSSRPRGIGLGLSIAYDIVKRHSGEIYVKGGRSGACFVIVLPLERNEQI